MKRRGKPSVFRDIYQQPYNDLTRVKLYNSAKGTLDLVQRLRLVKNLRVHNGCVNSICWSETGELILSGSDDQHLVVTHGHNYQVLTDYKTSHRANIFSAKFLPACGDTTVISCSGDGTILYTDLTRTEETFYNQFNCHSGTTYEVITVPNDPHSFLSCGEDGTVRWFDLRIKDKCNKAHCKEDIMISCLRAVTALAISPLLPYQLAVGCSDSNVRMFDRRMLTTKASGGADTKPATKPLYTFTVPTFENRSYRITSLCFSPEGEELLVSYSSDHLYLFSVKDCGYLNLKANSTPSGLQEDCSDRRPSQRSPPPVRRLRLRGDWSDTGPDARPEREASGDGGEIAQARPTLHATLMQRMTDVLSRMLNDPATRAALSGGNNSASGGESSGLVEGPETRTSTDQDPSAQEEDSETQDESDLRTVSEPAMCPLAFENPASSISMTQLSSLSIHSSGPGSAQASPAQKTLESSDTSTEVQGVGPSRSEDDEFSEEAHSLENKTEESQDHQNTHSVFSPHVKLIRSKINSLQDKLSTLREGFIERHGSEPAVRLTYSEKSSTNATISLGVADEVGREFHENNDSLPSTSSFKNTDSVKGIETTSATPASQSFSSSLADCQPGPSHVHPELINQTQCYSHGHQHYNSDDDDDDDDVDVDDEVEAEEDDEENLRNDLLHGDCAMSSERIRSVHPIEDHMEDAVKNARRGSGYAIEETCFQPVIKQKYTGHRNARTMIKEATFWGDSYVLSGSDCGHVFIWDRYAGGLVMLLEADRHVVNCLQPHPVLPLLATSGIDYDVKLWAPLHEEPSFDKDLADVLMKRNEVMLEETKDTITVPASFMIRMLACLNQIRRGGRNRVRNARQRTNDDENGAI